MLQFSITQYVLVLGNSMNEWINAIELEKTIKIQIYQGIKILYMNNYLYDTLGTFYWNKIENLCLAWGLFQVNEKVHVLISTLTSYCLWSLQRLAQSFWPNFFTNIKEKQQNNKKWLTFTLKNLFKKLLQIKNLN